MELANALLQLAQVVETGNDVVTALEAIRSGYSDTEYEALEAEHPLIASLISACCDLEHELGR